MPDPVISVQITATTQGFQQSLKQAGGAVQIFAQQVNVAGQSAGPQFAQNTKKGGTAAKSFSAILMGMGVAAGQFALQGILKLGRSFTGFIKGAVMSAARVEEMEGVLRNLGRQQGYTAKQMDGFTKSVVEAGIRTDVAQGLIAQFTRGEMDLAQASEVAKVAQDAAVLSMTDSSEALSRITYGIMTHNTVVLRTAGLTISASQAYAEYAKTIGKTAAQLSEADKTQAMLNAVMKEGENIAGTYDEAMKAPGKMLRSLPRHFYEIGVAVGHAFLGSFGDALEVVTKFAKTLKKMVQEGGKLAPAIEKLGEFAAVFTEELADVALQFLRDLPEMIKGAENVGSAISDTGDKVVMVAGYFKGLFNTARDSMYAITLQAYSLGAAIEGVFGALSLAQKGHLKEAGEYLQASIDNAQKMQAGALEYAASALTGESFRAGMEEVAKKFYRTTKESTDAATDAWEAHTQAVKNAVVDIENAELAMAESMEKANEDAQKKVTDLTIRETWRAIDEQIAAQRHLEDQQKRVTQARAQMQVDYNRATQQAAIEHGERRAEIEYDYQKRIAEIQANFAVSEEEAIRSRDALALVSARRERDRELKEAENARNEQNAEAGRNYQKQLENARTALQQQERELQEALAREAEEKRLADQREAEDRRRAHEREMGEIRQHQGQMLSEIYTTQSAEIAATQAHYDNLLSMMASYHRAMVVQRTGWGYAPPGGAGSGSGVQMMQHGGEGVVTRPTLFMAGEAGPEAFAFAPLRGGRGGGRGGGMSSRVTINQDFQFHGSFSAEEREWFREVARQEAVAGVEGAVQ